MSEVSAQAVKELRARTGAGMMDCKRALSESGGDAAKAEEWLRKKGIAKAASKGDRVAGEGMVGLKLRPDGSVGTLVEVNAETDFVVRNAEFGALVEETLVLVDQKAPTDLPALLALSTPKGNTLAEFVVEKIATIGENIQVRRFIRLNAPAGGVVGGYRHATPTLGALVAISGSRAEAAQELAREIAMQVAAMKPTYVDRSQVPPELSAVVEGKSDQEVKDFFAGLCLVDQPWVKDDSKTVQALIAETEKSVGAKLAVTSFARLEVGVGLPE